MDARVFLEVTIKTDGLPYDIAVVKSPNEAYAEKAVKAIKGWKFRPAHDKNGNSVDARVPIEVTFRRLRSSALL